MLFSSSGDLPHPWIEPSTTTFTGGFFTTELPGNLISPFINITVIFVIYPRTWDVFDEIHVSMTVVMCASPCTKGKGGYFVILFFVVFLSPFI